MLWFLVQPEGSSAQWCRVHANLVVNVESCKRAYREHGVPILAIARSKPRPYERGGNYDPDSE